jgi:hypothetical protein
MRMAGLMLRGMGPKDIGQVNDDGEQTPDTQGAGVVAHGQEVRASGPILYPAGKLYYLQRENRGRSSDSQEPPSSLSPSAAAESGLQRQQWQGHVQLSNTSNTSQEVYILIDVPPTAAYFQHALLTGQALRDHRSRAYRAGLLGVLQGSEKEVK